MRSIKKERCLKIPLDLIGGLSEYITFETISVPGPPWERGVGKYVQISIRLNLDRLRVNSLVDLLQKLQMEVRSDKGSGFK